MNIFKGVGVICLEDFKQLLYKRMKQSDGGADIRQVFHDLDQHEKGYVTIQDVQTLIQHMGGYISKIHYCIRSITATRTLLTAMFKPVNPPVLIRQFTCCK